MTAFGNALTQQKQGNELHVGYNLPYRITVKPKPIFRALSEMLPLQPSGRQSSFAGSEISEGILQLSQL